MNPEASGRRSASVPVDIRNPGDDFVNREIDHNRRAEFWLIPKAVIALAVVGVLVAIRQVFFL